MSLEMKRLETNLEFFAFGLVILNLFFAVEAWEP